jgi:hypothetical protein
MSLTIHVAMPAGAYGSDLDRYTEGRCSHGQAKAQAKEQMCLGLQGVHMATSDAPVDSYSGKRVLTTTRMPRFPNADAPSEKIWWSKPAACQHSAPSVQQTLKPPKTQEQASRGTRPTTSWCLWLPKSVTAAVGLNYRCGAAGQRQRQHAAAGRDRVLVHCTRGAHTHLE